MTETAAGTPAQATPGGAGAAPDPVFPPGRYGRRREPHRVRRPLVIVLAAAVAIAGVGLAVRLYQRYGRPEYQPTVLRFGPIEDSAVRVTFVVDKPGGKPAVCHLRALARDTAEVGAADVDVPAGTRVEVTHRVATSRRAFAVQVTSCGGRA